VETGVTDVVLTPPGREGLKIARSLIMPITMITLILLMVIPVPPLLLDIFFTLNIVLGLVILMASLNTFRPLEFSAFPTVLLFATIMRLSLNVASTRVVLAHGHQGTDAAGQVIKAFGEFITAGNFAIGLLVFFILVVINLVVIVKGTGRVSEVSARFTLDAMPGKQMAIDAEMNAGLLTPEEGKRRREEVTRESDFYGAMDGATKFVKGDAVAALLILAINIIGGLLVGTIYHDLSLAKAAKIYTTLAIGDGLVAQIPSLLLSLATAVIVTRDSSGHDLTERMMKQIGTDRAWWPVSGILVLFGLVPGMPTGLFLAAGALAAGVAWKSGKSRLADAAAPSADAAKAADGEGGEDEKDGQLSLEDVSHRTQLLLEVGYGLIPLIEDDSKSSLVTRITGIRKQTSRDLGFIIPAVRIRDNLSIDPNGYRITIGGVIVADDKVMPSKLLAIQGDQSNVLLRGEQVKDPTFGLDAVWIESTDRTRAQGSGYTVVDPSTVIATHFNQLLRQHASDLLTQDEVQALLDHVSKSSPNLVTGTIPKVIPLSILTRVLKTLLSDQISISDMHRILESIASEKSKEPEELVDSVRIALGPLIIQRVSGPKDALSVITLDPSLEQLIVQNARAAGRDTSLIEPSLGRKLVESFQEQARLLADKGNVLVVVTSPVLRRDLAPLVRQASPDGLVLSFREVPENKRINVVAVIGSQE
jgi:flagellar biosynthesis protein FlhA